MANQIGFEMPLDFFLLFIDMFTYIRLLLLLLIIIIIKIMHAHVF